MTRHIYLLLLLALGTVCGVRAQVLTTDPPMFLSNASERTITYHADRDNVPGLKGLPEGTVLYAYTGLETNFCTEGWGYTRFKWDENTDKNKFVQVAPDTYTFTFDLDEHASAVNLAPGERYTGLWIIARTADGGAQTADLYIPFYGDGQHLRFTSWPDKTFLAEPTAVTLFADTYEEGDIAISCDGVELASATASKRLEYTADITERGKKYNYVATVSQDGAVQFSDTLSFIFPNAAMQSDYPGGVPKMGPVSQTDGSVIFCLGAPGKQNVQLLGAWSGYGPDDASEMRYQDWEGQRYFWTRVEGLDPDTSYPYYFLVDGTYAVGDPYARLVLDPYSDKWNNVWWKDQYPQYPYDRFDKTVMAVWKTNDNRYKWRATDWQTPENVDNMVIYEILLRDFAGTEGQARGDGNLNTAIEKIPYLRDLGITAVELMPVMEFSGNNSWGYNPNFYMAPDKAYGTPDDYRRFVDECHLNGIAVILDVVLNHTDGLAPWHQMYEAGDNPFYNAEAPHKYSVFNDIRQEHPLWRQHFKDALQYWLGEYRVDGFRFDLTKGLGDSDSYGGGTDTYNASRVANLKRINGWLKEANPRAIHINESFAGTAEDNELGTGGMYQWYNCNQQAGDYVQAPNKGWSGWYKLGDFNIAGKGYAQGTNVGYMESHDESRVSYRAQSGSWSTAKDMGVRSLRLGALFAHLLMTPGPKMIWQFGETGYDEDSASDRTGPAKVRWNDLEDPDRKDLRDAVRTLVWFRQLNPGLFSPSGKVEIKYDETGNSNSAVGLLMTNGEQQVLVAANASSSNANTLQWQLAGAKLSPSNCTLVACGKGWDNPALTSTVGRPGLTVSNIPPNSWAVFATPDVAGVDDLVADDASRVEETARYDLQGRRVGDDYRGFVVIRYSDGTARKTVRR